MIMTYLVKKSRLRQAFRCCDQIIVSDVNLKLTIPDIVNILHTLLKKVAEVRVWVYVCGDYIECLIYR